MAIEFSERIRGIPVYPFAGGYAQDTPLTRLASNESPYPPVPAVREAIDIALATANRYPDPTNALLRGRLADHYGIPISQIAVGNGSCDILCAAGDALLEPGAEVLHAWPSFSVYPRLSASSGARSVKVALDDQGRHDLGAMLDKITPATRLIIVCNPNNPTSTALPSSAIGEFLASVPSHICVILDEAYCEFNQLDAPESSIGLLERHSNLVLLRTFSKVHGLGGLRVGFALCGSTELPQALNQVRQPFFCSVVAQAAAIEALNHQDVISERVAKTIEVRVDMIEGLRKLGLDPADSQANFCWVELGDDHDEQQVMKGLMERGVLVHAGATLGKKGALRISCGTPEENSHFLTALAEVL